MVRRKMEGEKSGTEKGGNNSVKREREGGSWQKGRGWSKQDCRQTVTDGTVRGRRERRLYCWERGGEPRHRPTAPPSPAASLWSHRPRKRTSLGSSSTPAGPMQDSTRRQHTALTRAPFSPALPFFDLTWVDLLLRGVQHGSMEEGCQRDLPTRDRGELEPFGAVAAVLDYLEDSRTDRRWEVCLPLANRYLKHQLTIVYDIMKIKQDISIIYTFPGSLLTCQTSYIWESVQYSPLKRSLLVLVLGNNSCSFSLLLHIIWNQVQICTRSSDSVGRSSLISVDLLI